MSDFGAPWLPFKLVSAAGVNITTIVTNSVGNYTPSSIGWIHAINLSTAPRFLRFFASSSPSGTNGGVLTFGIPGWGAGGAGYTLNFTPGTRIQDSVVGNPPGSVNGYGATGLSLVITAGAANSDQTPILAGEIILNFGYSPG